MTAYNSSSPDKLVLQADKEHGGIQFVIPLIMLAAGLVAWLLIDPLILRPLLGGGDWDSFRPLLRIVLTVVLGVAVGGVAEGLLKRVWVSGRALQLDASGLTVEKKGGIPERIEWDKRVNVWRWQYALRGYPRGGRERRIPPGHFLLACRLLQDDASVCVHSYFPPKRAENVPGFNRFIKLNMVKLYSRDLFKRISRPERPPIPSSLLTGQHGQLWTAEKERWVNGLELDPDDFGTLMQVLERHSAPPLS